MPKLPLVALLGAVLLLAASDPREALVGAWSGTSICTSARPSCHDEVALYRITKGADASTVEMSMAKVVDGQEAVMGVLPFRVDFEHHTLSADFENKGTKGAWTFSWTGQRMTGTLKLPPGGTVIRNIRLTKQ